jgi:hypothetical protein
MLRMNQIPGNLRVGVGLLCGAVLLGVIGCSQMSQTGPVGASAVPDPVLQDIPRPQGFQLVHDRTVARSYGRLRMAHCEYVGPAGVGVIKRFYEEYMPGARFNLRYWSVENGQFTLYFESANELCNVRIGRQGGKTSVVLDVGPLPRGAVDRESQPPMRRPG